MFIFVKGLEGRVLALDVRGDDTIEVRRYCTRMYAHCVYLVWVLHVARAGSVRRGGRWGR
jgi:hypothetical protein